MREIPLTRGFVALVDDVDYQRLEKFKWWALEEPGDLVYAGSRMPETGRAIVRMHRYILGLRAGEIADHIDGNGINNQRSNLRLCDNRGNRTCAPKKTGRSRFKGVVWCRGKWQSQIMSGGKTFYLGRFSSEWDAAQAYNNAAETMFGEFARLNIPCQP